ncbi:late transcription unit protein LtuB [Chlamydiifrater volucris]|uniref:late transcription unit protein LtuB n=1 Tax=Chlamydiifrater volucris TaxID=2681470 RepID=UPI001BCC8509|nr:late transcription unit protein LtuB [Chlamydiifrater volucris]
MAKKKNRKKKSSKKNPEARNQSITEVSMGAIKRNSSSKKLSKSSFDKKNVVSKLANSKELEEKARKFDEIVNGMLKARTNKQEKLLIFNHEKGFIYSDIDTLGKYSVKL